MSYIRKIEPSVRIECWSTIEEQNNPFLPPEVKDLRIRGRVYGHPGQIDGSLIKTSRIQSIQGKVIYTLNTLYELGEPDPDFIKWMKSEGISFNPDEPIRIIGL